jgi:hypothetical protein
MYQLQIRLSKASSKNEESTPNDSHTTFSRKFRKDRKLDDEDDEDKDDEEKDDENVRHVYIVCINL